MVRWVRLGAFALFGALIGTLGDKIAHEAQGVLTYPRSTFLGEPWWVPLVMAGAGVGFSLGHASFRRRFGDRPEGASTTELVAAFVIFAVAYLASGRFKEHPVALTTVFVLAFAAWAGLSKQPFWFWLFAISSAIVGSAVEMAISATGAFSYVSPNFMGVPMWLPALYLHVARLASVLERRWPVLETQARLGRRDREFDPPRPPGRGELEVPLD